MLFSNNIIYKRIYLFIYVYLNASGLLLAAAKEPGTMRPRPAITNAGSTVWIFFLLVLQLDAADPFLFYGSFDCTTSRALEDIYEAETTIPPLAPSYH